MKSHTAVDKFKKYLEVICDITQKVIQDCLLMEINKFSVCLVMEKVMQDCLLSITIYRHRTHTRGNPNTGHNQVKLIIYLTGSNLTGKIGSYLTGSKI